MDVHRTLETSTLIAVLQVNGVAQSSHDPNPFTKEAFRMSSKNTL